MTKRVSIRVQSNGIPIIRIYVLLAVFLTPFIDIANGLIGETSALGSILRMGMLAVNTVIICYYSGKLSCAKHRREINIFFICIAYGIGMIGIQYLLYGEAALSTNLSFIMKVLLYFSYVVMLRSCLSAQIITIKDLENFWKFSLWVIPLSLLVAWLTNTGNSSAGGNKGYFSSVNALTAVLIVQVVLALYLSFKNKKYIAAFLLNVITILMIGTKTPYIFLGLALIIVLIFDSKHRKKLLITVCILAIALIAAIALFFRDEFNAVLQWQKYFIDQIGKESTLLNYLLSGRDRLLAAAVEAASVPEKMCALVFGVGPYTLFSRVAEGLGGIGLRGIEMDLFEVWFSCGLLFVVVAYAYFFKAYKAKVGRREDKIYLNLAIFMLFAYSIFGGHVLTEALGGSYCAFLLVYKFAVSQNYLKTKKTLTRES